MWTRRINVFVCVSLTWPDLQCRAIQSCRLLNGQSELFIKLKWECGSGGAVPAVDCSGRPTSPLQPAAVIPSTCVDETRANTCGGTASLSWEGLKGCCTRETLSSWISSSHVYVRYEVWLQIDDARPNRRYVSALMLVINVSAIQGKKTRGQRADKRKCVHVLLFSAFTLSLKSLKTFSCPH